MHFTMSGMWDLFWKRIVPKLTHELHKGQCGRVAVVGGCEEYTGAPYFSAISSLKLGVDLSHVICDINAGTVIKSYSPELIVHPYLRTLDSNKDRYVEPGTVLERAKSILSKFHCLVVGPGMGRDPVMFDTVTEIIEHAKHLGITLVVDADALRIVAQRPDLVRGYTNAVLTPNLVEYKVLCDAVGLEPSTAPQDLSRALGGVCVLKKGKRDVIAYQGHVVTSTILGSPRRFGGQGDVLTGALGCFLAWKRLAGLDEADEIAGMLVSCLAASAVTRTAAQMAFDKHDRGTTTTEVIAVLSDAFANLSSLKERDVSI